MSNVFISYRSSDIDKVRQLAEEISNAGHRVWFDELNIGIGDSIIKRINEGLEGANYLVLCYSSSGVDSPWITAEWMSALARQLDGENIKLLPVLLSGGRPPAILRDRKYADLMQDWSKGVAALLKAIQ